MPRFLWFLYNQLMLVYTCTILRLYAIIRSEWNAVIYAIVASEYQKPHLPRLPVGPPYVIFLHYVRGVRILCPMNKTQTIVVSVIVGESRDLCRDFEEYSILSLSVTYKQV